MAIPVAASAFWAGAGSGAANWAPSTAVSAATPGRTWYMDPPCVDSGWRRRQAGGPASPALALRMGDVTQQREPANVLFWVPRWSQPHIGGPLRDLRHSQVRTSDGWHRQTDGAAWGRSPGRRQDGGETTWQ